MTVLALKQYVEGSAMHALSLFIDLQVASIGVLLYHPFRMHDHTFHVLGPLGVGSHRLPRWSPAYTT